MATTPDVESYARHAARYVNEFKRSLAALVGIAQGLLADQELSDQEITFLDDWLRANDGLAHCFPGDIIYGRIRSIVADGVISDGERQHLVETLRELVGGAMEDIASAAHVTELAFDPVETVVFNGRLFCLTGQFVYAPRAVCEREIEQRGGYAAASVVKGCNYVVVGGLGSPEWKHGSFGTKIERAMELKRGGASLAIVHEDVWAAALARPAEPASAETPPPIVKRRRRAKKAEPTQSPPIDLVDGHLSRSIIEPIAFWDLPFDARWHGADQGLVVAWESGRRMAVEHPDRAARARQGELVQLPWKGGTWRVSDPGKVCNKRRLCGALHYLAMWQGLRGEDLDVWMDGPQTVCCSRTLLTVSFLLNPPDVVIAEDGDEGTAAQAQQEELALWLEDETTR